MQNIYEILDALKILIKDNIPEIRSVKIGVEAGISAKDTPFVRLIPDESYYDRDSDFCLDFNILLGTLTQHSLEETYELHHLIEQKIVELLDNTELSNALILLKNTLYDRDEVENFKATLLQFTIKGL